MERVYKLGTSDMSCAGCDYAGASRRRGCVYCRVRRIDRECDEYCGSWRPYAHRGSAPSEAAALVKTRAERCLMLSVDLAGRETCHVEPDDVCHCHHCGQVIFERSSRYLELCDSCRRQQGEKR